MVSQFEQMSVQHINFRKNVAKVLAFHTYLDSKDDFEREPFAVYFRLKSAGKYDAGELDLSFKPKTYDLRSLLVSINGTSCLLKR